MFADQQVIERGVVIAWKGAYGWLRADLPGKPGRADYTGDVFCHFSAIEGQDGKYRHLAPGTRVRFVRQQDNQGRPAAAHVTVDEKAVQQ
jgi:cold shock CspA family protein